MEEAKLGLYRAFAVALLVVSVLVFLEAYYYHRQILGQEMPRAEVVTKITSSFWSVVAPQEPGMRPSNGPVTEDTAVMISQSIALVFAFFAVCLVWIGRKQHGRSELDVPIFVASGLVGAWIIVTVIQTGGISHA